jgi:cytochrome c-type biogenesis protein CcmH
VLILTAAFAPTPVEPLEAQAAGATPDSVVDASGMTPEELDAMTARVADQLRCTVCRNQSVLESSADLSREMQAEIRRRLASGDSPEEVKAYFVDRYGEWILLRPRPEGLNLLVYILPAAGLLLGALLVWRLLLTWSTAPATEGDGATGGAREARGEVGFEGDLDPDEEARLEAALREDARGEGP